MIEINNLTKFKLDKKSFSTVAKKVLKGENRLGNTRLPSGREKISLAFVDVSEMKKLNKEFRHKDKPTDVLSFELKSENLLGEVIICPEVVKEKGEDIIKVFVHGILHLCGYDHEKSKRDEKIMEAKQEKYLTD